jgi:hypothetical protein
MPPRQRQNASNLVQDSSPHQFRLAHQPIASKSPLELAAHNDILDCLLQAIQPLAPCQRSRRRFCASGALQPMQLHFESGEHMGIQRLQQMCQSAWNKHQMQP